MRKFTYLFCAIALVGTCLMGCQNQASSAGGPQSQQLAEGTKDSQVGENVDDGKDLQTGQNTEAPINPEEPWGDPWTVYMTEEQFHPMTYVAEIDGITYQILSCEVTSQFGERNLETLWEDIKKGESRFEYRRADANGNLPEEGRYIFLTIQFTNTTDEEVEILRNNGSICFFDENLFITNITTDVWYVDEYWEGGTPSEVYHYKLAPGESVTSEVGWIMSKEEIETYGKMYYTPFLSSCSSELGAATDPNAIFMELDYE